LFFPLIPFFVQQIKALIVNFPIYLNKTTAAFGVTVDQKQLQAAFSTDFNTIGENAFALTSRVFGGVISVVTILVVSFYMLFYHDKFKLWLSGFFYKSYHTYSLETLSQIEDKLGAWLRGQLILCITIGLFSWIALSLLGVPFALPLALLAGILEILPTLGPMLSAIPSLIVAITISPTMAIVVALTYFVIQFFENHILVPKIMQRAVGLNPIVVILAIMIGANLMGIAGALLSIPFISFIIVLLNSIKNVEK
jgi:predicted PurR-regulated permease PerM